jgi:hypothetical protein
MEITLPNCSEFDARSELELEVFRNAAVRMKTWKETTAIFFRKRNFFGYLL